VVEHAHDVEGRLVEHDRLADRAVGDAAHETLADDSSSLPGAKLRPSTIESSSLRSSKVIGCTPRNGTFVTPPRSGESNTARYASIAATGPRSLVSISGTDLISSSRVRG
jgi:hypothetical protein